MKDLQFLCVKNVFFKPTALMRVPLQGERILLNKKLKVGSDWCSEYSLKLTFQKVEL